VSLDNANKVIEGAPGLADCPGGKVGLMADTANPESFEEIVEWAYSTLPQKIRRRNKAS
jgi:hypothetical protein